VSDLYDGEHGSFSPRFLPQMDADQTPLPAGLPTMRSYAVPFPRVQELTLEECNNDAKQLERRNRRLVKEYVRQCTKHAMDKAAHYRKEERRVKHELQKLRKDVTTKPAGIAPPPRLMRCTGSDPLAARPLRRR
jgi:hypothetical protein